MVSKVLQEGLEADSTTDAGAIADVSLFRPLDILPFSQDWLAGVVRRLLKGLVCPTLMACDVAHKRFLNTGIAHVYRSPVLRWGAHQAFIRTGFKNLCGVSRTVANGNIRTSIAGYGTPVGVSQSGMTGW